MFVLLDLGFLHFISYWKRCTHSKGAMKKRKDKRSIEVLKCYDFHLEKKSLESEKLEECGLLCTCLLLVGKRLTARLDVDIGAWNSELVF